MGQAMCCTTNNFGQSANFNGINSQTTSTPSETTASFYGINKTSEGAGMLI